MSSTSFPARAVALVLLLGVNAMACGTRALKGPGGADGGGGLDGAGGASAGGTVGSGGATSSGGSSAGETGAAGASGGNSGGAGGAGGATGGAGGTGHDACVTDADCPPVRCVVAPCPDTLCTLGGDGFHLCVQRAHPTPLSCQNNPNQPNPTGEPCCSSDAECTAKPHGMCVPLTFGYCGGPAIAMANSCRYDECQADADCAAMPHGVCVNGYPRRCEDGPCRTNADCNQGPGGTCVQEPVGVYCPSLEVFCRYANDPCTQDSDCKTTSTFGNVGCVPNDDRQGTVCKDEPIPL